MSRIHTYLLEWNEDLAMAERLAKEVEGGAG